MSNAKWNNNELQFARLIAELEAAGAFTETVMQDLCISMDLEKNEVTELIDRAQKHWDEMKDMPTFEELEEEGEEGEHYSIDDEGASNAGDGVEYLWRGRRFEVCVFNGAGETPAGTRIISELIDDDED